MSDISRGILLWAPNEQNQHFTGLRKKIDKYIWVTMILRGLLSLDWKYKLNVTKKRK